MKTYLSYWKDIDPTKVDEPIKQIWSKQYSKLQQGDKVWICEKKNNDFVLCGYVYVDSVSAANENGRVTVTAKKPYCIAKNILIQFERQKEAKGSVPNGTSLRASSSKKAQ